MAQRKTPEGMREAIELILTAHALCRLDDRERFPVRPALVENREVRLFHFRRVHSREDVWMCQLEGGFLVGLLRTTRRRQMLIAMTAISRPMFRKPSYVRVACHRVLVGKVTLQGEGKT